jgi:butyryl-CoA dehydrogenase
MTDKSQGVNGISMFFIEAGTKGLTTGHHEDKMGIRTSNTCDVVLDDCRVPESALIGAEGKGFDIAMKTLDQARAWMGCVATGIAQRAIQEALAYAKKRVQFGRPVIKNQAIQFKLADMEIKTETARQITAHALTLFDMGLPFEKEAAIAKCYASDIAMQVASEAIQIFGGYGYSKEYPVEKLLRDAKIFQIFEGTNEVQRIVIAFNMRRQRR